MKFGSVCSGIEAASVAWNPLGWEAAWLSEIEPFPSAVLKHHYPDVPNLGDMTALPDRILSGEVEAPDLFCGGTPCQAFSVAGLRNSLDDARGNLSLTFVGIANAIDHVRSVRRDSPAIIFWENVPGVLSTKDNAFGCFLGALAGEDDPIVPPGEKWTNAGCVYGPQRTVAWRVLDAQYFGVAQRRRRVFVVASARDDFNPTEVLFEFNGVRRDTAPSREKGQRIAPCVTNGPPFSRTGNERVEAEAMIVADCGVEISGPLSARDYKDVGTDGINKISAKMVSVAQELVGALDTECGCTKMNHQTIASGHIFSVKSFYESSLAQYREDNISGTIKASGGVAGGGSETFLAQPTYAIQGSMIGRNDNAGPQGDGINEEVCFTQNTIDRHAVAQPIAFSRNDDGGDATNDLSPTMRVAGRAGGMLGVAQPVAFQQIADCLTAAYGTKWNGNASATNGSLFAAQPMVLMDQGGSVMNVQTDGAVGTLRRETHGYEPVIVSPTLTAANDPSRSPQSTEVTNQVAAVHSVSMAVRRLTPIECERLQGFPDKYTEIPWRKKPADQCPDGPRYKALGNSWAVPVVHWIGKRIQAQLEK
jgi:DNA (cytosine-5)-methyltransferase 1